MQRLREKIILSLLGWLLITMIVLAIVTHDPGQLGRPGVDLVVLLTSDAKGITGHAVGLGLNLLPFR
jgi:hypothetical protein